MFTIEAIAGKNRLVITVLAQPGRGELSDVNGRLRAAAKTLQEPFDILTDLSMVSAFDADMLTAAWSAASALREFKVKRVVRVLGRSPNFVALLERVGRAMGTDAHVVYSRAEADALLDGA